MLRDAIMTRRLTAYLVACLALVAGGCGTGADDPSARDVAKDSNRQAGPPQSRDTLAPSTDPPTSSAKRPATLAERLRVRNAAVWVEVRYDDGSVFGSLQDREVRLGRRAVELRQIRRLRGGPQAEVELSDGTRLAGQFEDLRQVVVTIGEAPHPLDLTHAVEVLFTTSYVEPQTAVFDTTIRGTVP
jgi:hypothetical protein